MTDDPLAGVAVVLDPAVAGVTVTTAGDGTYSADLPIGVYTLTFSKANFTSATATASVVAGGSAAKNVALVPTKPVVVSVAVTGDAAPGSTLNASATVTPLDGSSVESVTWSQTAGPEVSFGTPDAAATTVDLPDLAAFKAELLHVVAEPPIGEDELPPDLNIEIPEGFSGLLNRFGVQALNPFQLEEAGLATVKATVKTSSGTYTAQTSVHAALPWTPALGLLQVPVNVPVLLNGKDLGAEAVYDWALAVPGGSGAALADATTRNPYFTPDVSGVYTVTVTDTTADPAAVVTLSVRADTWKGAISGQDDDGRPLAAGCTGCHNGTIAPDNFSAWAQSGHAEIFTDNFNTSTHYSTACLTCHTVGYDTAAANGGMDDAPSYADFLGRFTPDGSHFHAEADNYDVMLSDFPDVAKLANIQCENCHGPNPSSHFAANPDRISLASEVCAVCHGEPARHGRFQQWQLSRHANYELAIEEGPSTSCAPCHSAQGYIQWADKGFTGSVTAPSADEVHPQTCVVCHEPHNPGNLSGEPNTATVRVSGDTPRLPAGFVARNVGRGAICMTCHNTRRDLKNDIATPVMTDRAPHEGAQADVLMGQNAFFVDVGARGAHSLITDTCTNCHMSKTAPPALLSYNMGGTNHTFQASATICSNCHSSIDAAQLQAAVTAEMQNLEAVVEAAITDLIAAQLADEKTVKMTGLTDADENPLPNKDILPGDTVAVSHFGSSHGRQAVDVTVNGEPAGHVQIDKITVDGQVFSSLGGGKGQAIVKAGWNLLLIENDRSLGVHNPRFTFELLNAGSLAITNAAP